MAGKNGPTFPNQIDSRVEAIPEIWNGINP
jgi:hypothetical protein